MIRLVRTWLCIGFIFTAVLTVSANTALRLEIAQDDVNKGDLIDLTIRCSSPDLKLLAFKVTFDSKALEYVSDSIEVAATLGNAEMNGDRVKGEVAVISDCLLEDRVCIFASDQFEVARFRLRCLKSGLSEITVRQESITAINSLRQREKVTGDCITRNIAGVNDSGATTSK